MSTQKGCTCNDKDVVTNCGWCGVEHVHTFEDDFDRRFRCKVHSMPCCGYSPDLCSKYKTDGYTTYTDGCGGWFIKNEKLGKTYDAWSKKEII